MRFRVVAALAIIWAGCSSEESKPLIDESTTDAGADGAPRDGSTADAPAMSDGGTSDAATTDSASSDAAADVADAASDAPSDAPDDVAVDAPSDAPADVVDASDASDASDAGVVCGPGPYTEQSLVLPTQDGASVNVTVTSTACPGTTWTFPSHSSNVQKPKLTTGVGQSLRLSSSGYYPAYTAGAVPSAFTVGSGLVSTANNIWSPSGWNPSTEAIIVVAATKFGGSTAPCDDPTGATFAVTGHAEAIVKYDDGSGTFPGTSHTKGKTTVIRLVPSSAGEIVHVTGTLSGCTMVNAYSVYTGDTPVELGAISNANMFVKN